MFSRLFSEIFGNFAQNVWDVRSINFERPFTPRGWLRLASNFGKTRFGWSPTFHFSTSKKNVSKLRTVVYPQRAPFVLKLWENAFRMIPDSSFFDANFFFFDKNVRRNFFVWLEDTCVLARRHMCPGQKTHVSWPEDTSVLATRHICPG